MALGNFIVTIGARIRDFTEPISEAQRQMQEAEQSFSQSAAQIESSIQNLSSSTQHFNHVSEQTQQMRAITRAANREMRQAYQRLNDDAELYANNTSGFMDRLEDLGRTHRRIMDNMINNNSRLRTNFLQTVANTLARSNWSDSYAANMERSSGATRLLDRQMLRISGRMENLARRSSAAALALEELGPTANMRDLLRMTRNITRLIPAIQMMQLGGAIVTAAEVYLLVKLSNAIDGRLIPAFERFKEVWQKALKPFVKTFTDIALAVLNFGTAIGGVFAELAANNPILSKMIFGFLALIPPLFTLLAPLALGLTLWRNFRAVFAATMTLIRPFIVVFFGVIGTVMAVSAAIVIAIGIWTKMMNASKQLRTAVSNAFTQVKTVVMQAIQPLLAQFSLLKAAFLGMVNQFLGGGNSIKNIWQVLGNKVASVINSAVNTFLPLFKSAFQIAVSVISGAINLLTTAFQQITIWWTANGPIVMSYVRKVWALIQQAFGAIFTFLMAKMPAIKNIVTSAFRMIKTVVSAVAPVVGSIVKAAFMVILAITKFVFPYVKALVISVWQNIKNIISSAIAIITNVIQAFSNLFQGNWSALWENIKSIVANGFKLLWNLFQVWGIGKIFGLAAKLGSKLIGKFGSMFSSIVRTVRTKLSSMYSTVRSKFSSIYNSVKDKVMAIYNTVKDKFNSMLDFITGLGSSFYNAGRGLIDQIVSGIQSAVGKVTGAVSSLAQKARDFLPFSPAKTGPLSDIDKLNFGGPVMDSIKGAIPKVQTSMAHMLQLPQLDKSVSGQKGSVVTNNQKGGDIYIERMEVRDDQDIRKISRELYKLQRRSSRANGVTT